MRFGVLPHLPAAVWQAKSTAPLIAGGLSSGREVGDTTSSSRCIGIAFGKSSRLRSSAIARIFNFHPGTIGPVEAGRLGIDSGFYSLKRRNIRARKSIAECESKKHET